jgi:hypothetical protein
MHLRGPMNVSQLAVYQLPSDMHTLQKRNTVPFYKRRRALIKREADVTGQPPDQGVLPLHKRTFNNTTSCSPRTVATTITVADCEHDRPTSTPEPLQNTTYVGPSLLCTPTSQVSGHAIVPPQLNCTCQNVPAATALEHHGNIAAQRFTEPKRDVIRRAGADWSRVAYYTSAAPAQATGLSFLANLGDPQQSGTFD